MWETHWERLCALLDDEALDQVCEDLGLDYRLGCFGFTILLSAAAAAPGVVVVVVVVGGSISRGHDWSGGRHPPLSTGNTGAKKSATWTQLLLPPLPPPCSCCTNTQSMQGCSLMFHKCLGRDF